MTLKEYLRQTVQATNRVQISESQAQLYQQLKPLAQRRSPRQTLRFGTGSEYLPSL